MATANNTTNQPLTVADLIETLRGFDPTLTVKLGEFYTGYGSPLTQEMMSVSDTREGKFLVLMDAGEE